MNHKKSKHSEVSCTSYMYFHVFTIRIIKIYGHANRTFQSSQKSSASITTPSGSAITGYGYDQKRSKMSTETYPTADWCQGNKQEAREWIKV